MDCRIKYTDDLHGSEKVLSVSDLESWIETNTSPIYEIIDETTKYVKPYFDVDLDYVGEKPEDPLNNAINFVCQEFSCQRHLLAITDSCRPCKYSYHLVITDRKIETWEMRQFVNMNGEKMSQLHIDTAPYNGLLTQKFRMVGTSKKGLNAPLKIKSHHPFYQHLITNTADLTHVPLGLPPLPAEPKRQLKIKPNVYTDTYKKLPIDSEEAFEKFKSSEYWNDALSFYKSDKENRLILQATQPYDCKICNRQHSKNSNHPFIFNNENGTWFFCRRNVPAVCFIERVVLKPKKGMCLLDDDDSEPMPLETKLTRINHTYVVKTFGEWDDEEEMYVIKDKQALISYLNKYLKVIMVGSKANILEVYYKDGLISVSERTIDNTRKLHAPINEYFKQWIMSPNRATIDRHVWIPYTKYKPENLCRNDFNTFSRFLHPVPTDLSQKNPSDKLNIILNHLKEVWCNNDQICTDFLFGLLATKIQNPQKTKVCVIVKSEEQGTGKSIIGDFLLRYVFGEDHVRLLRKIDDLFDKFNCDSEKSVLAICEELGSNGAGVKKSDNFKEIVTGTKKKVEPKGLESRKVEDYEDYICFTNNNFTTRVERTDRRYFCLEASDKYRGNSAYFSNLVSKCLNKDTGREFWDYFMCYDLSKFDIKEIPLTKVKSEWINVSLTSEVKAVMALIADYQVKKKPEDRWFVSEFMTYYKYVHADKKFPENPRSLSVKLSKILGIKTKKIRKGEKTLAGFEISVEEMKNKIKEYLKDPNLKFEKDNEDLEFAYEGSDTYVQKCHIDVEGDVIVQN